MDCKKIELGKTNRFSTFFLDYIAPKEELKPFYNSYPAITNFSRQLEEKSNFSQENRDVLVQALIAQYAGVLTSESVKSNIALLKENNTFTITTGHQLNILTGPLYFLFKIVTVINACSRLRKEYPSYNFVPVFWMATEDHDFEEINNTRINGKKYTWQSGEKGAVGRFDPSSIQKLLNEIPGIPDFFKEAYSAATLAEAVRFYVNYLFGEYGLVILDGDDAKLKYQFKDIITDDVLNKKSKKLVDKDSDQLNELGYKPQVFPREINFFYLGKGFRERIEEENGRFRILDTALSFSREEIKKEIEEHPEHFSPNVILRPLYEEMVLPNLAYVGGPAEMVYWLQLKSVFEHYKQPFPILLPRNYGMIIPENLQRKIEKTGIPLEDLFLPKEELAKKVVLHFSKHEIKLNGQLEKLQELFDMIRGQAEQIDPTLAPHVEAQKVKTSKRLEIIEKKFIRAEKRNQSDKLGQVEAIVDYLFPNGGLQERSDNFLNFYTGNPGFIDDLVRSFDPFDFRFHILNYGK